jgi:hypothetical protein
VSDDRAELADIFLDTVPDLPGDLTSEVLSRTFAAPPAPYAFSLLPDESPTVTETDHTDPVDDYADGWTFHPEAPTHPDDRPDPADVRHDHDWDLDGDW